MLERTRDVIAAVEADQESRLLPAAGVPSLPSDSLPPDLRYFYGNHGGAEIFPLATFPAAIVPPAEFLPGNEVVVEVDAPGDRSNHWYLIATSSREPLAVIDLHPDRLGRCYDAFYDVYGVVGSMAVIALSFTDLIRSLLDNRGAHWWWLEPDWESLGDAYD